MAEMDIFIDKPIGNELGEINVADIKRQLAKANGQPITVRIHCEGGSVFEGLAMFDAFKAYAGPKKCIVESAAFSMASLVAMAFPERQITANGYLMIHRPYLDSGETPPVMENLRNRLVSIYAEVTRRPRHAIEAMMNAETFLDAGESVRNNFATGIVASGAKAVALFQSMVKRHDSFRKCIVAKLQSQQGRTAQAKWKQAVTESMLTGLDRTKAVANVDREFPGLRARMIAEANGRA